MPLIGPSFYILGLFVASAIAESTTSFSSMPATTAITGATTGITGATTDITGTSSATNTGYTVDTSSNMNLSSTHTTIMPSTTKQKGGKRPQEPIESVTTPKPIVPSKSTSKGTTAQPHTSGSDSTGIIILILIIIVALGFGVACLIARKRQRRYSVDFTARPDEVNIPLSTVEPDLPADTVSPNGLHTFESAETTTKEPQEPEAKAEVQEETKAEADKSAVEPAAESAAPAPSPDSSGDKPKEDVAEPSPPAPVQPSAEEKTDDEGVVSNKTSVESLKETNENNSNNADTSQKRDLESNNTFWDVPLHCPV